MNKKKKNHETELYVYTHACVYMHAGVRVCVCVEGGVRVHVWAAQEPIPISTVRSHFLK